MILESWKTIASQIEGLERFVSLILNVSTTSPGIESQVKALTRTIKSNIGQFKSTYAQSLSREASNAISLGLVDKPWQNGSEVVEIVKHIEPLTTLAIQLNYLLSDVSLIVKSRSERAFLHLKSSILVRDAVQSEWADAFTKGEPKCEQLGALHLLSHGIFAFKADGQRGRTDLILNGPPDIDLVNRLSEGTVLTEWKKADQANWRAQADSAKKQAELYVSTTLSNLELYTTRYIVLVSDKELKGLPIEEKSGDFTFKIVNIVINPATPSATSKTI